MSSTAVVSRVEWLKKRRQSIGASEAAAVIGMHPYHSPMSLYYSKISEDEPSEEQTDYQEWGTLLEPVLAAKYASVTNRRVLPCQETRQHPKYPWLTATPDCLFIDPPADRSGPLELKTADRFKRDEELPIHWQIQNNVQMDVFSYKHGSFGILGPFRKFYYADLDINASFLAYLIEHCQEFWERHVMQRIPPESDGHEATTEALKRLYPRENGSAIELPASFEPLVEQLATVKANINVLEAEERAIENSIKARIGEASYGILPDGTGWQLATVERKSYTVEATSYRQLRRRKKGIAL